VSGGYPRRRHTEVLGELLPLAGCRLVDIGCGAGPLVRALTRKGARVTGIEPQAARVAEARAAEPLGEERYHEAGPRPCRFPTPARTPPSSSTPCTTCRWR
jgi:trans-aconitate methyltransferase